MSSEDAAYFSMWFDIGGLIGGIIAGLATDITGMSASVCSVMLVGAIPLVIKYVSKCLRCLIAISWTRESEKKFDAIFYFSFLDIRSITLILRLIQPLEKTTPETFLC